MEVSKELLNEVLNLNLKDLNGVVNIIDEDVHYNLIGFHEEYPATCNASISIYKLAHKCKEWAFWNDYEVITRARIPDIYRDEHKIDNGYIINHANNGVVQESWWIDSEPEAIFKACQWILDNKEAK